MEFGLQALVATSMWVLSIVVYARKRLRGERDAARLVAFWIGFPWTWASKFLYTEGVEPPMPEDDAGLEELVREIRDDRELRSGAPSTKQSLLERPSA